MVSFSFLALYGTGRGKVTAQQSTGESTSQEIRP